MSEFDRIMNTLKVLCAHAVTEHLYSVHEVVKFLDELPFTVVQFLAENYVRKTFRPNDVKCRSRLGFYNNKSVHMPGCKWKCIHNDSHNCLILEKGKRRLIDRSFRAGFSGPVSAAIFEEVFCDGVKVQWCDNCVRLKKRLGDKGVSLLTKDYYMTTCYMVYGQYMNHRIQDFWCTFCGQAPLFYLLDKKQYNDIFGEYYSFDLYECGDPNFFWSFGHLHTRPPALIFEKDTEWVEDLDKPPKTIKYLTTFHYD